MVRLRPFHWRKLAKAFERDGWRLERVAGDHLIFTKMGYSRPLVIPKEKEVDVFIINNNIKTAKLTREEFFKLLE